MSEVKNLKELRQKKATLQKEVSHLDDLLKFKDKKESLSAITNGFTDKYLEEKVDKNGQSKLALNTKNIMNEFSSEIKTKFSPVNSSLALQDQNSSGSFAENALKIGATALIGGVANSMLKKSKLKNKAMGVVVAIVVPIALKFLQNKLEDYQRKKSINSLKKLI